MLDCGLAATSGQTTRQYFANSQHSPNLDKYVTWRCRLDSKGIPAQHSCEYYPATCTNNKHTVVHISVSIPSDQMTNWLAIRHIIIGSKIRATIDGDSIHLDVPSFHPLFGSLHKQQINFINHGKNLRSHLANPQGLTIFSNPTHPSRLVHFSLNEPAGSLDLGS